MKISVGFLCLVLASAALATAENRDGDFEALFEAQGAAGTCVQNPEMNYAVNLFQGEVGVSVSETSCSLCYSRCARLGLRCRNYCLNNDNTPACFAECENLVMQCEASCGC